MARDHRAHHRHHAWCCCRCSCRWPSSPASAASCSASSPWRSRPPMVISAINALHPEPGAVRGAAEARTTARRAASMRARVLGAHRLGARRLRRRSCAAWCASRVVRLSWSRSWSAPPATACSGSRRQASCRRRTRARSSSPCALPEGASVNRTADLVAAGRGHHPADPAACRACVSVVGLQLHRLRRLVQQRLLRRAPETLRGAHGGRSRAADAIIARLAAAGSPPSRAPSPSRSTCRPSWASAAPAASSTCCRRCRASRRPSSPRSRAP